MSRLNPLRPHSREAHASADLAMIDPRLWACALIPICTAAALSQDKPAITAADYERFESLGGMSISNNGKWFATSIRRGDGDTEIQLRSSAEGSGEGEVMAYASGLQFSDDSSWAAYRVGTSAKEREAARKSGAATTSKIAVRQLASGESTEIEGPSSFGFSPDSQYLVMRFPSSPAGGASPASGRRGAGRGRRGPVRGAANQVSRGPASTIVVRNLASGIDSSFGNVSQYSWLPSGHMLAMLVSTDSKVGNGVRLYDPAEARLFSLHSSGEIYSSLSPREETNDLAVLVTRSMEGYEDNSQAILTWRNLGSDRASHEPFLYDPTTAENFPEDKRITGSLRWTDSGNSVVVTLDSWEKKQAEDETPGRGRRGRTQGRSEADKSSDENKSNVEIWNAKDAQIYPAQARRGADQNRPETAVVHLETESIALIENGEFEQVRLLPGQVTAIGLDETPYEFEAMFGRGRRDVISIDVATGEQAEIAKGIIRAPSNSPSGRYLLYMSKHQYFIHDLESGATTNLTADLIESFVNLENDHPVPEQPGYGVAGWLEDDRAVIVYDKYDLWRFDSDGSSATRLSDGRERGLIMRLIRMGNDKHLDLDKANYLSLSDPITKASGYGRLEADGTSELILLDKAVGGLTKAKEAEVYGFSIGAYDDSPDYFVGGPQLADAEQLTETNPFQDDYAWGRSEIVQYTNKRGLNLQGALFYPAGYVEGRQYPMVVYMYEKVSQSVHRYVTPSQTSPYNTRVFTSNGYFVLQPDIVFEARKPGPSVVDCVEAAVGKVVSMGAVDPKRIGCVGHSWGGFDSSFLATHSDIFATTIAGAPVTNLLTMWGTISERGSPETGHNEVGQERMDVPWWVDLDAYIKSSPVHGIEDMNQPMLMCFGGSDGNVNPLLGYEFYNAARRLGKEMVLLVYPGENHSLRQKPNQIDYQQRILEWFGTYLKGEPPAKWITEGMLFPEIDAERARIKRKAAQAKDVAEAASGSSK